MSAIIELVDPEVTGSGEIITTGPRGGTGGYKNYRVRFAELLKSESVERWLRKRQPTTKAEYLNQFTKVLAWTEKEIHVRTPEQLLKWARKQPDGLAVQDLIDEYAGSVTKSTAHMATACLRSFLQRNGYRELPKIDWEPTMGDIDGYRREDILGLLGYLDNPVQKLYVYAAVDSGLRAKDLLWLKIKHLQPDLAEGKDFVAIRFERERYNLRKAPGRTFLGPQSLKLLRELIKSGKISTAPETRIFPWPYRTITYYIDQAKKQANLKKQLQPSHGLRKFYTNSLDRVGMDFHRKLALEGHALGVRKPYTSKDIEALLGTPKEPGYKEAYRYLDLSESSVVSNEVTDLQRKVKQLEEEKKQDVAALREEVSRLEKLVAKVLKGQEEKSSK